MIDRGNERTRNFKRVNFGKASKLLTRLKNYNKKSRDFATITVWFTSTTHSLVPTF